MIPALHIRMSRFVVRDWNFSAAVLTEGRDARSHSMNVAPVVGLVLLICVMIFSALCALRPLM